MPIQLYNTQSLAPETIPDDQISDAVLSGSHSFKAGTTVPLIDQYGEPYQVSAEELPEALQSGYKVETPTMQMKREFLNKYSGLKGDALVGAGQAINQLGFGTPKIAAEHFMDPWQKDWLDSLEDEHKLSDIVGGTAGFAGSMVVGGPLFKGAAKAGEAAKAVTEHVANTMMANGVAEGTSQNIAKTIVSKMVGNVAKGATEGAIIQAPTYITEKALGDPDAAGESLLYGVGLGAGFGAVVTPLASKLADLAKSTEMAQTFTEHFNEKLSTSESLQKIANEKAVESLNGNLGQIKKLGLLDEMMRQEPGESLTVKPPTVDSVGQVLNDENILGTFTPKTQRQIYKDIIENKQLAGSDIQNQLSNIDQKYGQKVSVSAYDAARSVADDLQGYLKPGDAYFKPAQAAMDKISPFLDAEQRGNEIWTLEQANKEKSKWQDVIKTYGKDLPADEKFTELIPRAINNQIHAKIDEIAGREVLTNFLDAKNRYANLSAAAKLAETGALKEFKNNKFGLTSWMLGAGGVAGGLATGHVGLAAAAGAELLFGRELTRRFANQVMSGAFHAASGVFAAKNAMTEVATRLDAVPSLLDKLKGRVSGITKEVGGIEAARRVFGLPKAKNKQDIVNQIRDKTARLVSNPGQMIDGIHSITNPISQLGAPTIAASYAQKMANANQYLAAQVPKLDETKGVGFAPEIKKKNSDHEINAFLNKVEVVDNPFSVMDHLQNGTLNTNHVQALAAVYPKIYEGIKGRIIKAATDKNRALPYATRLKLSMLMGAPLDKSVTGKSIMGYQTHFQTTQANGPAAEEAAATGAMPGKSIKVESFAKNAATPMQRLAMK